MSVKIVQHFHNMSEVFQSEKSPCTVQNPKCYPSPSKRSSQKDTGKIFNNYYWLKTFKTMFTRGYFQIVSSDEGLKHLFVQWHNTKVLMVASKPISSFLEPLKLCVSRIFVQKLRLLQYQRKKQELHSKFSISSTTNDILMSTITDPRPKSY